jgi:membrane protein YdbS with pleckstrin-like domain
VTGEPGRRLASDARWLWRVEQLLFWGAVLVAGVVVGRQLDGALALLVQLVPLVLLVVGAVLVPELRWRRWRWDVRPEAIDIQHGTLTIRRTLVPMVRVQHVDTTRGLLEQAFSLSTVVVHTAAGSHRIPLLTLHDADELRERIADLARTADGT